jgi:hypothetical protein
VDPIARERVQQHMALHWQYLKQTNPTAAKQLAQKIQQIEKAPTRLPSRVPMFNGTAKVSKSNHMPNTQTVAMVWAENG